MTTLKAVQIPVFELFVPNGESLGLFRVHSKWQGMRELRSIVGEHLLIVDSTPSAHDFFGRVFGDIFRTEPDKGLVVVKASTAILEQIEKP